MNDNRKKIWFVTGASKGLGLALVKTLLAEGFRVAATSRRAAGLTEAVGAGAENFLPLEVDLTDERSVADAVRRVVDEFGTIDVVVNNAGYGQIGTLEELSGEEARKNFDVNVFALLNVIRQTMPRLRAQRSGHVFNISSIGGFTANFPGWGVYCATKFAVAGLTESFAAEAKAFGVTATVVYPGYFRTDFLAKDSVMAPARPLAEYEEARKSQAFHEEEMNGRQPGDPEKAARALIRVAAAPNPPVHLFLGSDAYRLANDRIGEVERDLEDWKSLTLATDFEARTAV